MKGKFKSFFAILVYLFITFIIQLTVSLVGGGIIGVIYAMKDIDEISTSAPNIDAIINKVLESSNYILLVSSIVTVLIFLLIYKVRKKNFKEELQIVRTTKSNIIIALGLGLSAWLFNVGVLSLVQEAGLFKEHFSIMENLLSPLSEGSLFISILTVGIIAPFTEEFIFRGVIFNTLNKNISILWTIIIQAVFFGLFHGNLIQSTYATLLGLVFGYITYKTKSLWTAVVMHMINNTIATISPFVFKNLPSTTMIFIGFMTIGALGLIISIYFINKKNMIDKSSFISIN